MRAQWLRHFVPLMRAHACARAYVLEGGEGRGVSFPVCTPQVSLCYESTMQHDGITTASTHVMESR